MWWRGTWRRARHGPRRSRGWWARWWRQWRRRQTQGFLRSRFGGHVLRRRCAPDPGKGEGRPHRWTASQPGARPTCKHRAAFIAEAARSTNALRHTATTHAMTCRFVACKGRGTGRTQQRARFARCARRAAARWHFDQHSSWDVLQGMQPRPSASGAFDAIICGPSLHPVNGGAVAVRFLDRDKTRRARGWGRPPPRRPTPVSRAEAQTLLHGDEDLVGNKARAHRKNPVLGIG